MAQRRRSTSKSRPRRKSKPLISPRLKRRMKAVARRAWQNHRKNAKARRAMRRSGRRDRRSTRRIAVQNHRDAGLSRTDSWLARHGLMNDLWDAVTQKGHEILDAHELRGGVITEAEFNDFDNFDTAEEWRAAMRARRSSQYRTQRAAGREHRRGGLTMVYGGGHGSSTGTVKAHGFRTPQPRPVAVPRTTMPVFAPPNPRRRPRKNRPAHLVTAWGPQLTQIGRNAMAADANLNGALQALQAYAEQYPETRTQVHEHAQVLVEFAVGFGGAMETFMARLRQGNGDSNPGMPPEVVDQLKPLTEVDEIIRKSCQQFSAAWEDYFREAIRAAQDEHTPSKEALTS